MTELQNSLPPGWDCKLDPRTNRYYYINHYTRLTTWEDPRNRYRQIHGNPSNVPNMPGEQIQMQEMNSVSLRMSPVATKIVHAMTATKTSPSLSRSTQETSLTTVQDTEQSVAKISAMFPTVSETHIRLLLKKYMKSLFPKAEETIILDVLGNNDNNVQKTSEALKEMGYDKIDTFKLSKKGKTQPEKTVRIKEDKSKEEKPVVPKIKTLQEKNQMKSSLQEKYKDIPERVIVIALESVDYDKNKAVQILEIMVKEEKSSPKTSRENKDETDKSQKEKAVMFKDTLQVPKKSPHKPKILSPREPNLSIDEKLDFGNKARRTKEKINSFRNEEDKRSSQDVGYQSVYLTTTAGPNPKLVKGSNEGMLLEDYVTWDGPDPNLRQGSRIRPKGPDSSLLSKRIYEAHGPNKTLCRGPALGLAKGSLYSQLKSQVVGESRGK